MQENETHQSSLSQQRLDGAVKPALQVRMDYLPEQAVEALVNFLFWPEEEPSALDDEGESSICSRSSRLTNVGFSPSCFFLRLSLC